MALVEAARAYFEERPAVVRLVEVLAPLSVLAAYVPEVRLVFGKEALIGWGMGMVGCALAGLAEACHRYRIPRTVDAPASQAHSRDTLASNFVVLRFFFLVVFIASVTFLVRADVAGADYTRSGFFIIAYSVSRLFLALSLFIACFTLGALALETVVPGFKRALVDTGSILVLCFFSGASLYGLIFVLLGWFGLIGLPAALALTVPILVLAPSHVSQLLRSAYHKASTVFRALRGPQLWVRVLLVWCTTIAGVLLVLSRGLYPGQTTNDVWEHYLHYYRDVLASGSLGPHPTWYHFHLSKGAGLFYLAGSLSDELAPQLVSLCFILVATLVGYLITRRFTGDPSWALLAATVFLTTYRGDFFKHHDVLTGFIAFFVWSTLEIGVRTDVARRVIAVVMPFVAFYVGFYLPVGSAIVALFWLALLLPVCLFPSWRFRLRLLVPSVVALSFGVAATMLLNYLATGLAETVPLALFWSLADHQKFESIFGVTGIPYLLQTERDRLGVTTPLVRWLLQTFRYHHLHVVFPPAMAALSLLAGVVAVVRNRSFRLCPDAAFSLVVLAMFSGTTFLLSYFVRNVSLSRMYAFTALLMSVSFILLNRAVIGVLCTSAIRARAQAGLLSLLGVFAIGQSLWYNDYTWGVTRESLTSFFLGRHSVAQVLLETDGLFKQSVKLDFVYEMRKFLARDTAIVNLGHDPGPANAFPAPGLIGGSNHALGPRHLDVIFGEPSTARSILQSKQLNFFLYDLRNGLAHSLAYSRLFRPENLDTYFRSALTYSVNIQGRILQGGYTYLLTWRETGHDEPIPDRFRQVLELAQTDVLRYSDSEVFRQDLNGILETEVSRIVQAAMQVGRAEQIRPITSDLSAAERISHATVEALTAGFTPVTLARNQALLDDLTQELHRSLTRFLPELDTGVREWMAITGVPQADRLQAYSREFGRLLQVTVSQFTTHFCTKKFGEGVAKMLTTGRNPLSQIFARRENVEDILSRRLW